MDDAVIILLSFKKQKIDNSKYIKRGLDPYAIKELKRWARINIYNPYPTEEQKIKFMELGLTLKQIDNWFSNFRRRKK
jgi:hypothetical protein